MKIAFFVDSLPPNTDGVAHTFTKLTESLHKNNDDYRFFSPFVPETDFPWHSKVDKVPSVSLFLYPNYRIGLPVFKKIENELEQFKPDIVHASSPTLLGKTALTYARKNRIPAVSSYHTDFISYFKYYNAQIAENLGWSYLKWFYNQFERIYAPSNSILDVLRNRGLSNLELWQRGIDSSLFSSYRRNEALRARISPKGDPILLFVGRLVGEKDLNDLISMNHLLKLKQERFKLVIVGDGPMRVELQQKIPDAYFTGILKGKELAQMYASADIFTFPSTTETFGNVILEAAASGLPAVGVNKGGVQDIIAHGQTGFIAQANDPQDFTLNVQRLLKNEALRKKLGDEGQQFASRFNWDFINLTLITSYQALIDEQRIKLKFAS